tara:strand:- start:212 stop:994 length:783 start_codon:yes stop_codon:yes gene_type:complete
MRIALSVEYNGANYFGWQKQKIHKEKTIQYYIDKAISKIADENISTICAGRTDTGVHAFSQIVHFDTNKKRLDYKWLNGINSNLPNDIVIKNIYHVDETFHARYSALARTYRYIILNQEYPSTYLSSNVLHLNKKINISKIKSTFKYIKGEKDFSCFRASGCSSKSPIKNIKSLKINSYKNFLYIDITANSFLYHMVRNIIGTLIDVGTSKYESNHVIELISSRDRKKCGKMVLPNGLYLKNITYPKKYNLNSEDIFPYF